MVNILSHLSISTGRQKRKSAINIYLWLHLTIWNHQTYIISTFKKIRCFKVCRILEWTPNINSTLILFLYDSLDIYFLNNKGFETPQKYPTLRFCLCYLIWLLTSFVNLYNNNEVYSFFLRKRSNQFMVAEIKILSMNRKLFIFIL